MEAGTGVCRSPAPQEAKQPSYPEGCGCFFKRNGYGIPTRAKGDFLFRETGSLDGEVLSVDSLGGAGQAAADAFSLLSLIFSKLQTSILVNGL